MRTNISYKCFLFIFLFILTGSLQLTSGQTHIASYTIPSWNNATGSFTFEAGTIENPVTQQKEGYFKIILDDGEIVEITPRFIDSFIQKINNSVVVFKNTDNLKINEEKITAIEKLQELKSILEDKTLMNELITKMKNTDISGLNWDYTVQTIRNFQTQITGTLD